MAAGSLDVTAHDYALKEIYTDKRVAQLVYTKQPFFAEVAKFEKFGGDKLVVPVQFGNPQGVSDTFSTAQTNRSTTLGIRFELLRKKKYGVIRITNEAIEASMGDVDSFIRARKDEIDGILHSVSRQIGRNMFSTSGGAMGQIGTVSTTRVTLLNVADVVNFEVGMEIATDTVDGTGTVNSGTATITAIDRDLGYLDTDSNWTSQIATAAANDYLFIAGSYGTGIAGLASWLPATAPTSGDSFFGVDRSTDPTRLAGVRVVGTSLAIEEALQTLLNRIAREGGSPDRIYLSHSQFLELDKALGAKVQYVDPMAGGDVNYGFQGIKITSVNGPVTVIPDINCPNNVAYALELATWRLDSLGPAPKLYNGDGQTILRVTDADEVEARVRFYGNLECNAPGHNGRVSLTAA